MSIPESVPPSIVKRSLHPSVPAVEPPAEKANSIFQDGPHTPKQQSGYVSLSQLASPFPPNPAKSDTSRELFPADKKC